MIPAIALGKRRVFCEGKGEPSSLGVFQVALFSYMCFTMSLGNSSFSPIPHNFFWRPAIMLLLLLKNVTDPAGRSSWAEERRQSTAFGIGAVWLWQHPKQQLSMITIMNVVGQARCSWEEGMKAYSADTLMINLQATALTWMKRGTRGGMWQHSDH